MKNNTPHNKINAARRIVLFHESCFRQRASCFATSFVPGAPIRFRFAIAVFRLNTPSASRPKNLVSVTGSMDCSSASVSWFSGLPVFSASATTAPTT